MESPGASETTGETLAAAFDRDGYCVIDPGIPEDVLDAVLADVRPMLARADRVQDAWRTSAAVRRVALWPRVLETLQELYGRRARAFQTLHFPKGTEQKIHSDTIHFSSIPSGLMCGVWVALEDVDETNGPLAYYPGSHRWPEITMLDLEREGYVRRGARDVLDGIGRRLGLPYVGSSPHYAAYERYVEDLLARTGARKKLGTIRKGQAIVWAANLLHGGAKQLDRTRTRYSQVTHYYLEGGLYYTPLLSEGRSLYWRSPRWVTE